jgi:hypothetical protein
MKNNPTPYQPTQYKEIQKDGKNEYYTSFQFDPPDDNFTHLNQTPFIKGTPNHVYDNQWNTLYSIYQGEADIKRSFFKKETEQLFEPRKDRQPNYNNEWENVHEQREIYQRSNPNTYHNFERPKGTRIFTSRGVDPFFRRDTYDENDKLHYEACPSYDWYRIPEYTLEQLRNKTRPKFDVTQNISSGARPIFNTNLNAFMPNRIKPPRYYKNLDNMLLNTTGKFIKNTINPDYTYHKNPMRPEYCEKKYKQPINDNNLGHIINNKHHKFNKKSSDIQNSISNIHGNNKGLSYQQRDLPYKFNNHKNHRELQQLKSYQGNIVSDIEFPSIPSNFNKRKNTLLREKHILKQNNINKQINYLPSKPYINDPSHIPKYTKRQYTTINKHTGQFTTNKQPHILYDFSQKTKKTKRQDIVHNKHSGNLTSNIKNNILHNTKGFQLKPTYRYNASIQAGKIKGNVVSLYSSTPAFDRNDKTQAKSTKRENTLYSNNGNITGNYNKLHISKINQLKPSKKSNVTDYTPNAASNIAHDPHFYDPNTLTHDVKKYTQGYTFTNNRAKIFGEKNMTNHKLKNSLSSKQYKDIENRHNLNPDAAQFYVPQFNIDTQQTLYTNKSQKLPEINSRCISIN